jgi:hypothetical protein
MSTIGWPMEAILPRSMALRATGAVARKSGASRQRDPGQSAGELRCDHDKGWGEGDADRASQAAAAPENHRDRR